MRKIEDVTLLPDCVKAFVMQRLAGYETAGHIAGLVAEFYHIQLSNEQILQMNPAMDNLYALGDKWEHLFEAEREKAIRNVAALPFAGKLVRMKVLLELYNLHHKERDHASCVVVLASIKREMDSALNKAIEEYNAALEENRQTEVKA